MEDFRSEEEGDDEDPFGTCQGMRHLTPQEEAYVSSPTFSSVRK